MVCVGNPTMIWLTSELDQRDVRRRISSRFDLRSRTLWLVLAAAVLLAGAALNWLWLVASGIGPFLLPALPCLAMCALHFCSHGNVSRYDRREASLSASNRIAAHVDH